MILRLTRLAHGNHEMQRMLTEKGFAYAEALATLSAGGAMQKAGQTSCGSPGERSSVRTPTAERLGWSRQS